MSLIIYELENKAVLATRSTQCEGGSCVDVVVVDNVVDVVSWGGGSITLRL